MQAGLEWEEAFTQLPTRERRRTLHGDSSDLKAANARPLRSILTEELASRSN
jgi:hypothetical protein